MRSNKHIKIINDLQRLTAEQSKTIHDLVGIKLIESKKLDELINEMVRDRFLKGKAYIKFASKLDVGSPEDQAHIVSRNYYGMYHIARATVFHTLRKDIDQHALLAKIFSQEVKKIGKLKAELVGRKLEKWREKRNDIDYDPYLLDDIVILCKESISDANEILEICEPYLKKRGVNFESI
jgi:uncharacterized protein (UPF0332 family)